MAKKKTFWVSLCKIGAGALGVVITESDTQGKALEKAKSLSTIADDHQVYEISPSSIDAHNFPRDVLITPEELRKRGYRSDREKDCTCVDRN